MASITSFDKQNLKTLRQDINDALRLVATKHGINLGIGNITYDIGGQRFTTRITATTNTPKQITTWTAKGGATVPIKSTDDNIFTPHGFKVGDTFRHNTKILKVMGYNPRKPKNCVNLEDQNGKKFGASIEFVKSKI